MNKQITPLFPWLLLLAFFRPFTAWAQLPPLQPEQDCINAIPICTNVYFQPNSYVGEGLNPNEINPGPSCLNSGEKNDVWYIFTVQTTGILAFSIFPVNMSDDYDWAVYNLTHHNCADIYTTPSLEVSCNYSGVPGVTGPNGLGSGGGNPNNPVIPVAAGQTYVINVSNFSSSNAGYTLDLSASTAMIFDQTAPGIAQVTATCGGALNVRFTENVICSSVSPADFTVEGPGGMVHTVTAVSGAACQAGGAFDDLFSLTISPMPAFSGTYTVMLTGQVADNCGNTSANDTAYVTLNLPGIQALATPAQICAGDSALLSVVPQSGFTYTWANGLTGSSPVVYPGATTLYTVLATDTLGCMYAGHALVQVKPTPSSQFAFSSDTLCDGALAGISYTGSAPSTAAYSWNFGQGAVVSGAGQGPYSLSFPSAGVFPVSLSVVQDGCTGPLFSRSLNVVMQPTAEFFLPSSTCLESPTLLQYAGNAPAHAIFNWSLDGGMVVSGQGPNLTAQWNAPGTKTICLEVLLNGCVSEVICKTLEVQAPPTVDFSQPGPQCLADNSFSFSYTGVGSLSAYHWDFGDLTPFSNQSAPAHRYSNAGIFTVTLTATGVNGCSASASKEITVLPSPVAEFTAADVCLGSPVSFFSTTMGAENSYHWRLSNGFETTDSAFVFFFELTGGYSARLMVNNTFGCADTAEKTVQVYEQPEADFTVESRCEYLALPFTNLTRNATTGLTWAWDFGNGQTSDVRDPEFKFSGPGLYEVTLTAAAASGCNSSTTQTIEVFPAPQAEFQVETYCQDAPLTLVQQAFLSAGELTGIYWTLPGGKVAEGEQVTHTFGQAGIQEITLKVVSNRGCADSLTRSATVFPLPQPAFALEPVCEGNEASFLNLSRIESGPFGDQIASWSWAFGDGATAGALIQPTHTYSQAGIFKVTLEVQSEKGCLASLTQDLAIFPNPKAPQAVNDTVCARNQAFPLTLTDDLTARVWWYEQVQDKTPFYEGYGFATANMIGSLTYFVEAESENGCRSSRIPVTATVYPHADLRLVPHAATVVLPDAQVQFEITGLGGVVKSVWHFGDPNQTAFVASANAQSASYTYTQPGTYEVRAIVTDSRGCEYNLSATAEVRRESGAFFANAFSPNGDGVNDTWTCGHLRMEGFDLQVFNRWGQRVFAASRPDFEWDGNGPDGGPMPEGVYLFTLTGSDLSGLPVRQNGTLTILR